MPKFMMKGSYNAEGAKGLIKEGGTARRATVAEMFGALGGKLESFHYASGGTTVYLIADVPDTTTAAAVTLAIRASGTIDGETIMLLSPEEVDQAAKKSVHYRSPGKS
jgi:uncharacterized protein with GYD domain